MFAQAPAPLSGAPATLSITGDVSTPLALKASRNRRLRLFEKSGLPR